MCIRVRLNPFWFNFSLTLIACPPMPPTIVGDIYIIFSLLDFLVKNFEQLCFLLSYSASLNTLSIASSSACVSIEAGSVVQDINVVPINPINIKLNVLRNAVLQFTANLLLCIPGLNTCFYV